MMKKMKKRYVVATLIVLGVSSIYAIAMRFQNRFIVKNQTGQTIKQVQVEVCRQSYTLFDIPASRTAWSSYDLGGDSGYMVRARLIDGTKIEEDAGGYVTDGHFGVRDEIIIKADRHVDVNQSHF